MRRHLLLLGVAFMIGAACPPARAQETYAERPATCEPGFTYVETVEYREVERRICKLAPDKRTKWVYRTEPDYFCVPACPWPGLCRHGCPTCTDCEGPRCRPKLFKKLVEYDCGTK